MKHCGIASVITTANTPTLVVANFTYNISLNQNEYSGCVVVLPSIRVKFPPIDPAEVHLRLNTMLEDSYWLDDPKLEIENLA